MTAGQFSGVDLDRLADFVGGALDGAPDEAEIRRLVRDDPAWSRAYAELVPAVAAVRDQLADWGAGAEEPPPAVADRLDAALATTRSARPYPTDAVDARETVHPPDVVEPAAARDRRTSAGPPPRPVDRRRRWSRMARPVLVAALVTAVVGGGAGLLRQLGGPEGALDTGVRNNEAATTAESGGSGEVLRAPAAVQPVASGTNYDAGTLSRAAALADQRATGSGPSPTGRGLGPATEAEPGTPPAGLARLADPAALSACLRAVAVVHGVGPVTVQVVDLAAYRGEPAVVVVFTDGAAARWTWVSGPGCGLPTMGADTRDSSRVW